MSDRVALFVDVLQKHRWQRWMKDDGQFVFVCRAGCRVPFVSQVLTSDAEAAHQADMILRAAYPTETLPGVS